MKKKANSITCANCRYGVATSDTQKVWLCENPALKSYGNNVRHGSRFACGYGISWAEGQSIIVECNQGKLVYYQPNGRIIWLTPAK